MVQILCICIWGNGPDPFAICHLQVAEPLENLLVVCISDLCVMVSFRASEECPICCLHSEFVLLVAFRASEELHVALRASEELLAACCMVF